MGLVLGALVYHSPDFLSEIQRVTSVHFPEEYAAGGVKADLMVPVFILKYLPHGVIGVLIVAILSAAMSSLSSTINSLSAVTVEDFFKNAQTEMTDRRYMFLSKISVVFWGFVCIACAFLFGGSNSPVIEIINAIGSVFYGPVLATFVLAIFSKYISSSGMKAGIIISVLINLMLSRTIQDIFGFDLGVDLFWIWLNFTGFGLCVLIAYLVSMIRPPQAEVSTLVDHSVTLDDFRSKEAYLLISFFVLILIIGFLIPVIWS